jgi:hypothetical protein
MNRKNVKFHRSLLATACVLSLGTGVHAQPQDSWGPYGTYQLRTWDGAQPSVSLSDYILAVTAPQQNAAPVSALAESVAAGASYYGSEGSQPVTVTGNAVTAAAIGNRNSSSADLALLRGNTSSMQGEGDYAGGIALATSQLRGDVYGYGPTSARIEESRIAVEGQGTTPAATAIQGNTLSASVALNQSSSSIAGTTPAGQGATSSASSQVAQGRDEQYANTAGALNVATYQASLQSGQDTDTGASVRYSAIGLDVQGGGVASEGLSLAGNRIAADYVANSASGLVQATGANAFQGGAMVTNTQLASAPAASGVFYDEMPRGTALVADSRISAELTGDYYGYDGDNAYGPSRLDASLRLADNAIVAASTGNNAGARLADGTIQAGNAIVIDGASAVYGSRGYADSNANVNSSYANVSVSGDLGVLNTQASYAAPLSSRVVDSGVTVRVDGLQSQAAVALTGNRLRADATGNLAGNLVDVRTTEFAAGIAAGNMQSNHDMAIVATQDYTQITVDGGAGGDEYGVSGSTTLAGNAIAATAAGNVAATSIAVQATQLQAGYPGVGAQAAAQAWDGSESAARGGIAATNAQSNWGQQSIRAELDESWIGADLNDNWYDEGAASLQGATVSLTGNRLVAQATGNSAATGVTLAGGNGFAPTAVANTQVNNVRIAAKADDSGVNVYGGALREGTTVTVKDNAVTTAATANQATNTLSAKFASLDVSTSGYEVDSDVVGAYLYAPDAATRAAQGIASSQRNGATVKADNESDEGFAAVEAGSRSGNYDAGIVVSGNRAAATAAGNQVRNAIALDAGSVTRQYNWGPAAGVAAVSSNQENDGAIRARLAGDGNDLSFGASLAGVQDGMNVAVTGNAALATATANDADNAITVKGTDLALSSTRSQPVFVANDFNAMPGAGDFTLSNVQGTYGEAKAEARDIRIAVERDGARRNAWIESSTQTVSGNTIGAEARANNANNTAALTGFTTLSSSAVVANAQDGEGRVTAIVDNGQLRIRANDASIYGSQLTLNDNTARAVAVGASATNALDVQATNLQGGAMLQPVGFGPAFSPLGNQSYAPAGYSVSNEQTEYVSVSARTQASARMNLEGSSVESGAAILSGNAIEAVAQGSSASNALNLAGTTVGEVSGTVSSNQTTYGEVVAQQGAQRNVGGSFVLQAGGAYGTTLAVSNNSVLASAGQNEAFNSVGVTGATVAGQYSVLNAQQGYGSVSALAEPGVVGIAAGQVYGGNVTVGGNTVAAKAVFNSAANALALDATGTVAATGSVHNEQTTGYGSASAMLGGYDSQGVMVGVTQQYGQGTVLNGTAATVSGNTLNADAAGNTAANSLAVAGTPASRTVYGPAYAVLNGQTNQAAIDASVVGATLAVNGWSVQGSASAVTGNQVAASATGNSASNALSLGTAQSGFGLGAAVSNVQFNNASISAAVRGVTVGAGAGMVGGGSAAVTGNSISAQAVGNTAVNKLSVK